MMNNTSSRANAFAQAEKMHRRAVTGSVLAGVLMMGLGLAIALSPLTAGVVLAYLITGGLSVYGGMQILAFLRAPRGQRSGLMLAGGVLLFFFSLFTLFSAVQSVYGTLAMISSLTSVVAFFTLLSAVVRFSLYTDSRDREVPGAAFLLVSSILNVMLGAFLLINPIAGWFSLSVVWGVYLGVSGFSLMVESLTEASRKPA